MLNQLPQLIHLVDWILRLNFLLVLHIKTLKWIEKLKQLFLVCLRTSGQDKREAVKHFAHRPFFVQDWVQLHVGFDHASVGRVCQSLGPGFALNPWWGSRGRSSQKALNLRAFGASGLGYFEDLPTHFKPKKLITKVIMNYCKYSLSFAHNNFFLRSYKI